MSITKLKQAIADHRAEAAKRVATGFAKYPNLPSQVRKDRVAQKIFGDDWQTYVPYLAQGPAGLAKLKTDHPDVVEKAIEGLLDTHVPMTAETMAAACEALGEEHLAHLTPGGIAHQVARTGLVIHVDDTLEIADPRGARPDAVMRFHLDKHLGPILAAIAAREAAAKPPAPPVPPASS